LDRGVWVGLTPGFEAVKREKSIDPTVNRTPSPYRLSHTEGSKIVMLEISYTQDFLLPPLYGYLRYDVPSEIQGVIPN
jgi:hypothetical protein